jgi:hypothetical protein
MRNAKKIASEVIDFKGKNAARGMPLVGEVITVLKSAVEIAARNIIK